MKENRMIQEIMEMISEINPYEDFDEETLLFEKEIVDSLGFVQLVVSIEARYGLQIDEEQIVSENFKSIRTIEAFLQELLAEK